MKCPQCQAENSNNAETCSQCGARLNDRGMNIQGTAQLATNTGILLGRKAREARLTQIVNSDEILSDTMYNGVIGGVLVWGLLINYLLCEYAADFVRNMNPIVLLIGYLVLALGGTILSAKSQKPLLSFLGYNMVVIPFGLVISLLVSYYTEIDPSIVTYAFLYTLLISVAMIALVMIRPQFFAKLGGMLLAVLGGLILCEVVLALFGIRQEVTDWLVAGVFCLYIGYDIYRSQQYPKTLDNAVDSALDIYMDLANLFIRILSILARSKSRD